MRFGYLQHDGERRPFVEVDGERRLPEVAPGLDAVELAATADLLELARRGPAAPAGAATAVPVCPGKIVAIGLNYLDHVRETGMAAPQTPLVFCKFTTSLVPDAHPIRFSRELTSRVDWEVELAAVIGTRAQNVDAGSALDHVLGYTVANDVSARDVQFADGQWVRGKSLDTFCPLGPVIVTPDELPDPQALRLGTAVNGDVVQDSSTAEMVFGVAELIAFCSRSFTLEPGDVLLTGTPWGCGEFMDPQRHLGDGDVVETWVEGIGTLRNPVEEIHGRA
jgi:2-keto-4-pentenoate hydratase/2-oxohepta-3-ene-1,7-dioic acid hydratase in catechol pathway